MFKVVCFVSDCWRVPHIFCCPIHTLRRKSPKLSQFRVPHAKVC